MKRLRRMLTGRAPVGLAAPQVLVNAQCRADEVSRIRRRGTSEERHQYLEAADAWTVAGQPDVPFIIQWHQSRNGGSR